MPNGNHTEALVRIHSPHGTKSGKLVLDIQGDKIRARIFVYRDPEKATEEELAAETGFDYALFSLAQVARFLSGAESLPILGEVEFICFIP